MAVDVVFRGDLVPGSNIFDVKEALREMFKLDEQRIDKMFDGRPVVVKRGISDEEAQRYQAAFFRAGAQVELKQADVPPASSAEAANPFASDGSPVDEGAESGGMVLKPLGSDMLNDAEKHQVEAVEVDISGLSLAPDGSDVLDEQHKKPFVPRDIDTSHLDVD